MDMFAGNNTYVNMRKWFTFLAWDIISDLAFGQAIGFVERVRSLSICFPVAYLIYTMIGLGLD